MGGRVRAAGAFGGALGALVVATVVGPVSAQPGATYQLSVLVEGRGKVLSNPRGIDCGSDCAQRYSPRTAVALAAIPETGYELESWGGNCSGAGACSVTMSGDRRVTARFRPKPPAPPPPPPPGFRRLDIAVYGGGGVKSAPGGIACGADCSQAFPAGTRITLRGTAKRGFRFGRWRGACTGKSRTCTLTLGHNAEVEAGFVPRAARRRTLHRRGLFVGTDVANFTRLKGIDSKVPVIEYGGGGNDRLIGGLRNDVLIGGTGRDRIKGGKGRDLLIGGTGRDRLAGGPGNDTLYPGGGAEAVDGGSGRDTIITFKKPTLKDLLKKNIEKFIVLGPPIAYSHGPGAGGYEKVWALEPGAPGKLPAENEPITDDARGERHPSWSPSGYRLTYQSVEPAALDYDVFVANQDGSGKKNITKGNGVHDTEPAWSPDGKRIAFIRNAVLHTMKTNGTDLKQLTPSPSDFNPSWSPDGQKIYFARTPGVGDLELFSISPNGSGLTQLTANDVHDDHPAISPDGKGIAWDAGVGDAPGPGGLDQPPDIQFRPFNFAFPLQVAAHPLGDSEPAWSPNGKKLVFHSVRDGNDLWTVKIGGSGLVDITNPGFNVPGHNIDPAWRW